MYGPLEYVVIQFAGNGSISEILPLLMDLEQRGCVQLLDLIFISKDEAGELSLLEINELAEKDMEEYELISEFHGLLTEEDVAAAAVTLPENTSAVVMLFEHSIPAKTSQELLLLICLGFYIEWQSNDQVYHCASF